MENFLDERSEKNFLTYANSVIKSRAIPSVEDNLKPIHRKILYTLWEDKVFPDKPTKKCATEAGRALAYSPHGDASVYGALVRMSQWWKLRYPLVEMQGNAGNILGDSPAASRYTECRLSPIGMLMLEDLNKNAVDFKPNYDETTEEPITLPSKFPYLLCGNNSGIAVGMSSDLVSHNFTEVMGAINYYMDHKGNCSTADLMQFIKGPDFPTGGLITNGEDLLNIYSTGNGSIKVYARNTITKNSQNKTIITFHDLPYGVTIDDGVKAPLKKLVIEDGYDDMFEDINVKKVGPKNFDIIITLAKGAKAPEALNILYQKTRLASTIKINQTVIVNGEPKTLSLKELIGHWINYRSNVIKRIAQTDYDKTKHKLTVTIGLQKCLSDIDLLIDLIRNANDRNDAKAKIKTAFELNDEQADAVLDMKLSRLNRLDLDELNKEEKELEETLAKLKKILDNEDERYLIIKNDLKEIKKVLGSDDRLTEITYTRPNAASEASGEVLIKKEWHIYKDGTIKAEDAANNKISSDLIKVEYAYSPEDILGYAANGEVGKLNELGGNMVIGSFVKEESGVLIGVTKNGNIKVSNLNEYKWRKNEKVMKLKDDDELIFAAAVKSGDKTSTLILLGEDNTVLRLNINELPIAGRATLGVKSGLKYIHAAALVNNSDSLVFVNTEGKGKITSAGDFTIANRGAKGQKVNDNVIFMTKLESNRKDVYLIPEKGLNAIIVPVSKMSMKSRTAVGATLTSKKLVKIV